MERKGERRGLGRGLSALMADVGADLSFDGAQATAPDEGAVQFIAIDRIQPNPDQPRQQFEPGALRELADSIREKGVIQPLILRLRPDGDGIHEIVAGERRWRAAQIAQLHQVPAIIRDYTDAEVLEIAIVENIQRADLNAIEEAQAYRQLIDRFGHTQEKIAEALGKSRSHIANLLRLLGLPEEVQSMVRVGTLSAGHARALITSADPVALAEKVVGRGLSVRETEALARQVQHRVRNSASDRRQKEADTRVLEEDLSANLRMAVIIDHRAGGEGRLTIQYKTLEQLDQLCQLLSSVR